MTADELLGHHGTGRTAKPLAVVMCVYTERRMDLIRAAAASVLEQLAPGDEFVVVVDHNQNLLDLLADLAGATVVANTLSSGLSGARNTGVEASTAPIVVFLDDDAVPLAGWLDGYRSRFADAAVTVVAGAIEPEWQGGRPRWFPQEYGWVVGCDYEGLPADGAEVRNPIGASMAIRRTAFDLVGGFSERVGRVGTLPAGCEETEFSIRLRQADPSVVMVRDTSTRVRHHVSPDRGTLRYFVRRCYYEGRSKAILSDMVGTADGLSAERGYVARTLTAGALRHLGDVPEDGTAAIGRAAAIPLGLATAGLGFARGSVTAWRDGRRATTLEDWDRESRASWPGPLVMLDHQLADATTSEAPEGSARYRVLVLDGEQPRALVDVVDLAEIGAVAAQAPPTISLYDVLPGLAQVATPAASVVVPTKGRAEFLHECVSSLLAQDHPDFEIVVVDNNDEPTTSRSVLDDLLDDPRLRLVHEPAGGSSGARNRGLEVAAHEIIAATDDDVIADPAWLRRVTRPLALPEIAMVTGLVLPRGFQTHAQELFEEYGGFSKGFDARLFDLNEHRGEGVLYPYAAGCFGSGNNVAYRRDHVRSLGGYDLALGPGSIVRAGQDLDLFLKVLFDGGVLAYEPAAIVRHYHRDDIDGLERQLRNYGRGLSAVMTKWATSEGRQFTEIARRTPAGLRYLVDSSSDKNAARADDYPAFLRRAEYAGLTTGWAAYVKGRRRAGR